MKNPVIFAASANPVLATSIARGLNVKLGEIYHHQFPSGEWWCQLKQNIRGADVFLVQSIVRPANDNLMQILIMADAARRASAGSITAIIPYLGYSRQDRKDKSRVPISAKSVMDILQAAGINRIVTMDLHAPQIAGFTNLPFDHLYFQPSLINALDGRNVDVIVAPDIGAVKKAEEYSRRMKISLAIISKKRTNDTTVEATQFVGDVKGKNVLIVDDLTESVGTLISAAKVCRDNGAQEINTAVTHGGFTDVGYDRLNKAFSEKLIDRLFVSNTIEFKFKEWQHKVILVDVAPTFTKAICGIINNESISALFA